MEPRESKKLDHICINMQGASLINDGRQSLNSWLWAPCQRSYPEKSSSSEDFGNCARVKHLTHPEDSMFVFSNVPRHSSDEMDAEACHGSQPPESWAVDIFHCCLHEKKT